MTDHQPLDFDQVVVCMITFNEEEFLAHSLRALQAHFGRFEILDMGSSDRTTTIAQDVLRTGLSITHWPRENLFRQGFAAARNAAMAEVDAPWVLHVDADELLVISDGARRITAREGRAGYPAWKVGRRNLVGPVPDRYERDVLAAYETSSLEQHVRLFRRDPAILWRGYLHEEIFVGDDRATFYAPLSDACLDHVSHFKAFEIRHRKEHFYAWMLMNAYFDPDIRRGILPDYMDYTERRFDVLFPMAVEYGTAEGLNVAWDPALRPPRS